MSKVILFGYLPVRDIHTRPPDLLYADHSGSVIVDKERNNCKSVVTSLVTHM